MTRWLLRLGVLGAVIFVLGFVALGATRPGYDPIYTFVSQLALDGGGAWQTANFVVSGLLIVAGGIGLALIVQPGDACIGAWAASLVGLGFALLGVFTDDPWLSYPPNIGKPGIGAPVSWLGWGHLLTSIGIFAAFAVATWLLGRDFAAWGERRWHNYSWASPIALAGVYAVALVSGYASWDSSNPLGAHAGLFQRAALLIIMSWLAALATYFLRKPRLEGTG